NIWRADLASLLDRLDSLAAQRDLVLAPSCSLLHVPVDLELEGKLDDELKQWLAFAVQKIEELDLLRRALNEGRDSVADGFRSAISGAPTLPRCSTGWTRWRRSATSSSHHRARCCMCRSISNWKASSTTSSSSGSPSRCRRSRSSTCCAARSTKDATAWRMDSDLQYLARRPCLAARPAGLAGGAARPRPRTIVLAAACAGRSRTGRQARRRAQAVARLRGAEDRGARPAAPRAQRRTRQRGGWT